MNSNDKRRVRKFRAPTQQVQRRLDRKAVQRATTLVRRQARQVKYGEVAV